MKSVRPLSLGLTIGLLIGLLIAGSHQVFAKRDSAVLELPLSDIQLFTDIYARIMTFWKAQYAACLAAWIRTHPI